MTSINKRVLIIIDVQVGVGHGISSPRCNAGAEAHVAKLLQAWRERQCPIVHVQHTSPS